MINIIAAEVALCVSMQVGLPAPAETPGFPAMGNAFGQSGVEGQFEQRYPFDSQQNWIHGYHQEIPAYGGHAYFRPYNYKDVLSQSQTSAGWGQPPTMPYSQQFWHKYQDEATMLKMSHSQPALPLVPYGQMYQPANVGFRTGAELQQVNMAPTAAYEYPVPYQEQVPVAYPAPGNYAVPNNYSVPVHSVPSAGTRFPIAP